MKKGKIVLTQFPFTDLSATKRRPAVVVSPESEEDDVIVAFISSKIKDTILPSEYLLSVDHPDFEKTGLKVISLIKLSKLATLEKKILVGEIGECSARIMDELNARLKLALGL
jgi:mRNA interferase MazF